jgi:hypothetical protein
MATHKNNVKGKWRVGNGELKKLNKPSYGSGSNHFHIMQFILFIIIVVIATKHPNRRVYIL